MSLLERPLDIDDRDWACPWCPTAEFLMMDDDGKHYILCLSCRCCGPCCDSAEEALLAWLDRNQPDEFYDYGSKRTILL